MPVFIRYPLFCCVALALSACGGSGSSQLLAPAAPVEPTPTGPAYSSVNYPLSTAAAITAAIAKFGTAGTDAATASTSSAAELNRLKSAIVSAGTPHTSTDPRYLSTGSVLVPNTSGSEIGNSSAMCSDRTSTDPASCSFKADILRTMTVLHLGPGSASDEYRVSLRDFKTDREPVMNYRGARMSQVRTVPVTLLEVYKDSAGTNKYLLSGSDVLHPGTPLVGNATLESLLPAYKDGSGNEYLLTSTELSNKAWDSTRNPPDGVQTLPAFSSLSKVREQAPGSEQYVGYEGILEYSMFFVGVHSFFSTGSTPALTHTRFENASIGRVYDDNTSKPGAQLPSVGLTGDGVMAGVEWDRNDRDASHLVQGDVSIDYTAGDNADIDIAITNIKRLAGTGTAWYADSSRIGALDWDGLPVAESESGGAQFESAGPDKGTLRGSFYGTKAKPEVGGAFHHGGTTYGISGAFGSKLTPKP